MTAHFKKIAGFIILAGMLGLTACDSSNQNAASPTEVAATAQPEVTTSPAPTDAPTATAAATIAPNGTATASPQTTVKQLKELLELGQAGQGAGRGICRT